MDQISSEYSVPFLDCKIGSQEFSLVWNTYDVKMGVLHPPPVLFWEDEVSEVLLKEEEVNAIKIGNPLWRNLRVQSYVTQTTTVGFLVYVI